MIDINSVNVLLDQDAPMSQEIIRNAKVILTTFEGEVPYDRGFGMIPEILDLPVPEARELYTVECITKLRKFEPRATVQNVHFAVDDETGILYPKVVLSYESD